MKVQKKPAAGWLRAFGALSKNYLSSTLPPTSSICFLRASASSLETPSFRALGSTTNELHLTPDAQADLQEIKRYISRDLENPVAALATVKRIVQNVRLLRGQARIGTPLSAVTELRDGADYRYLTSGSYMIFCRAVGTDVYIDRVLYGGRDYLRVLGLRTEEPEEE